MSQLATTPEEQIFDIFYAFYESRALVVAVELQLADVLSDGPLHVDDVAKRTNTHAPSLFRLMRALESVGVFSQVYPRVFANSPASDRLRKNVPGSLWPIVRLQSIGEGWYEAWGGLLDTIRTGRSAFDRVNGCDVWEFLQRNPDKWANFNDAMRSLSVVMTPAVTASYEWSRFPVIADIGGGIGTQLVDILDASPSCRGILYDQPEVVASAIPHDRVQRIGGDFFQSVPTGADLYLLRFIIHNWAEQEAVVILEHIRHAMKPGSRVAIIEQVIPETPEFTSGKWQDLIMLIGLQGRERTAAEYRELLNAAGLELDDIVTTASPLSVLISSRSEQRPRHTTNKRSAHDASASRTLA